MKVFLRAGIAFCLLGSLAAQAARAAHWDGRVFMPAGQIELAPDEFVRRVSAASIIVMGEKHYTPGVQRMEGSVIDRVVKATGKQKAFTTAWEFLNATSQAQTAKAFERLIHQEISTADFLVITQGQGADMSYAPVIETTAALGGDLHGVNLSRAEKAPVVQNGIGAADPALVPPGFALGGSGYFDRFVETMQGHASPDKIRNYYDAQCLTDDVMAYHLLQDPAPAKSGLRFLIAGSFHTEYFDGTYQRLKVRAPGESMQSVRIFDASDYKDAELLSLLQDSKYGVVADYVIFVNEPSDR